MAAVVVSIAAAAVSCTWIVGKEISDVRVELKTDISAVAKEISDVRVELARFEGTTTAFEGTTTAALQQLQSAQQQQNALLQQLLQKKR